MTNQPIKISDNCWKHTEQYGNFYTKTSNIFSELHKEDGPAVENLNGYKAWYYNGKYHRLDGPAIEFANGKKAWYYNGKILM